MKQFSTLFCANLRLIGAQFVSRQAKRGKKSGGMVLLIFLALLMIFYAFLYSFMLADSFAPLGLMDLQLMLFLFSGSVISFISCIHTIQSQIFRARDLDMLLAMPISPWAILSSKLSAILVFETCFIALFA